MNTLVIAIKEDAGIWEIYFGKFICKTNTLVEKFSCFICGYLGGLRCGNTGLFIGC